MKQLLISRLPAPGAGLVVDGADFHYLHRVRRVRVGQVIMCRTADGAKAACRVTAIGTSHLVLGPLGETAAEEAPRASGGRAIPDIRLVQGIPKGKKLEQVVRQATELGVSSIIPLKCRHSVAEIDERWENKRLHLEGVIREAFQQSGGCCLPRLADPMTPEALCGTLNPAPGELVLFLHERELAQSSLHGYLVGRPKSVTVVIGPEGGFSPEEVRLFIGRGFGPVWLGPQVLRTETAAVVALGIVNLLLFEADAWQNENGKENE
jgi:16S rRNA (uracil1498-N3)-methyltransferase